MHGIIHDCLKAMIIEKCGMNAWKSFLEKSNSDEDKEFLVFANHEDSTTVNLIGCAAKMLGKPLHEVLELYGEYFYHYAERRGFVEMLHGIGRDFESFLCNLDFHHFFISSFVYGSFKAPSFRCEKQSDDKLILHYYSKREGLYPLVIGLARECGREIFNVDAEISLVSVTQELNEGKFAYLRNHVVLNVKMLGPYKEEQKKEIQAGPALSRFSSVASKLINLSQGMGICGSDLRQLHPFHVMFDDSMVLRGLGKHLADAFPSIRVGKDVHSFVEILHPHIGLDWKNISDFLHSNFVLLLTVTKALNGTAEVPIALKLKGQMFKLSDNQHMLFIGSPHVVSLTELSRSQLYLSDIPLHDTTRELALLNQQRIAEVELSKELERTTAELKKVSTELASEKQKMDDLLEEMLPKQVADALKEGKKVEACSYDSVTILFSDIVTFTVISSYCHPIQIVDMLNDLFTKFDLICGAFGVYKVETIGDAYVIAAGLPVPKTDHANRIADTALSMMNSAAEVTSPVDGKPIQIRIGIHSGPVMTGVVGNKQPRYCLFGDTVNVASRMESHGLPGKIHISSAAQQLIHNGDPAAYVTELRGSIKIKGKGNMKTYFLVRTNKEQDLKLSGNNSARHSDAISTTALQLYEQNRGRRSQLSKSCTVS